MEARLLPAFFALFPRLYHEKAKGMGGMDDKARVSWSDLVGAFVLAVGTARMRSISTEAINDGA